MYKQSTGMGYIIVLHVFVLATFVPPIEAVWCLLFVLVCNNSKYRGEVCEREGRASGGVRAVSGESEVGEREGRA